MAALRIGVVGAGWIAGDHIALLQRLGGVELVGVADLDRRRAEEAARSTGASVYETWNELFEREELDAVWVCTPPLMHRGPSVAALERGIHVFLEKPIARTLVDADAIAAAAARSGAVCAVGYQWRGTEPLDALREALTGQRIGLLAGTSIGPTKGRPWFLDRAQGGGNILERGSHQIDLLRAVAGEVVGVQAAASGVVLGQEAGMHGDIEDAVALVLHFGSGAIGAVLVAWTRADQPSRYVLDVVASESTLRLTLDPDFSLTGSLRGEAVAANSSSHPFERSVARFLEAVRAGDPSHVFCLPDDAARTLAVAVACEEALASGAIVPVPAVCGG